MLIENKSANAVTPQDLMPMKKILKDKYPELDIDKMFQENEFTDIVNLLLTR